MVNIEAKLGLKSSAMVWYLHVYYLKYHCLSYTTFFEGLNLRFQHSKI